MNKNKFIQKVLAVGLSVITMASSCVPAFAASVYKDSTASVVEDIDGNNIQGKDATQKEQSMYAEFQEDTTASTDVYVTQSSTFSVIAPVVAVLNGTAGEVNSGDVQYKVFGNIAGDEIISVEPDSTFELHQDGKDNITCTVEAKGDSPMTEFSYADGVRPDAENALTQDYTITAQNLTAGSWSGSYNTNISLVPHYRYYTALEDAITDANNGNYETADLYTAEPDNAEAALYFVGDTAKIILLKDAEDVPGKNINTDLLLDMRGNSVTFGSTPAYFIYNKNLTVKNGTFNTTDNKSVLISGSGNTESSLVIDNVTFNETLTSSAAVSAYAVNSTSKTTSISNSTFNYNGVGNTSYNNCAVLLKNTESVNTLDDCSFTMNLENSKGCYATQVTGNTEVTNMTANVSVDNATNVYGLNTATTAKQLTVNGADIYCDTANKLKGAGIISFTTESTVINSTPENPVNVYGKEWGIQTSAAGTTTINGGTYTSTDHTGYICGNADVNNAQFYITNRDKYDSQHLDTPYGLYCGGNNCPADAVVNFRGCTIGNPIETVQGYERTITSQKNKTYNAPAEINFYDSDLYTGTWTTFCFNFGTEDDLNSTKMNLYGDTTIYNSFNTETNKWNVLSSDELQNSIDAWKTTYRETKTLPCVGDKIISGNENASVDENNNVLAVYVSDDANVYDYR